MITRENIKQLMEEVTEEQAQLYWEDGDYMAMRLSIFNAGHYFELASADYTEELEEEIANEGGVFTDKDNFAVLYKESGANNPYLEEVFS